jgi:hypothetical protein
MDVVWLAQVLNRAFIAGTPLLLGTLGEIVTERSGVLNLGMEGMMAVGAVTAFMVGFLTGQPWLGFFAGACCSAVFSLIHAGICVGLKGKQVVSGLALHHAGTGFEWFAGKSLCGQTLGSAFPSMVCSWLEPPSCAWTSSFYPGSFVLLFPALCFAGLDLDLSHPLGACNLEQWEKTQLPPMPWVYLWEECKPWRSCWVVFGWLRRSLYLSGLYAYLDGRYYWRQGLDCDCTDHFCGGGILLKLLGVRISLGVFMCCNIFCNLLVSPPIY